MSQHNSQHINDPYSFTHVLHGMTEFFILALLFPRVPLSWRLAMAVGIEGWPSDLDTPVWTVAAGLAMYSGRLKLKRDWKRASVGLAGLVSR